MFRRSAIVLSIAIFFLTQWAEKSIGGTYTILNFPGCSGGTSANGISGNNIVGEYVSNTGHGYLYDGSSYITVDPPGSRMTTPCGVSGNNVIGNWDNGSGKPVGFFYNGSSYTTLAVAGGTATSPFSVSGNNVVGYYVDNGGNYHGFLYNGSTYTSLDVPGHAWTEAFGVCGNNVVGYAGADGFLYNGSTYSLIDFPGASVTRPWAISGNIIVGDYYQGMYHGFMYDGSGYTTIDPSGSTNTQIWSVSGNDIVGFYDDADGTTHGFLYNGSTCITLDPPGSVFTEAFGVSGNNVVGMYTDSSGADHGFLYAINTPEPSTLVLLGVGAVALAGYGWRRRRKLHNLIPMLLAAMVVLAAGSARADVFNMPAGQTSMQFVTVGDPGNVADSTGYGAVPYTYQIGKYDVTVGQYCQFLNAVAATDTYGLYNSGIGGDYYATVRITQTGSSGNYSYSVTGSYSQGVNCPIFDVTWGDAARFCNWLQNGQPTGSECGTTTENGAYTLNGATSPSALMAITRNTEATYFIPSENEWYKAAYYDPTLNSGSGGYWTYPTKSNTPPGNTLPDTGNNANYANDGLTDPTNLLTPVGAFSESPSAYGTFDQGGDVWQWNETVVDSSFRGQRGGSWFGYSDLLASSARSYDSPANEDYYVGFRVASIVPEPGSIMLLVAGGLCLLAYAWRRRRV